MEKLSIREKLLQLFVVGFKGLNPSKEFYKLLEENLSGVIFFAENFDKRSSFKKLSSSLYNNAKTPLFMSVDEEGGLVQRTIKLDKKFGYLTPLSLNGLSDELISKHYEIMSEDILDLGLNVNFAPVLDVNTNPFNPIIGVRSFSSKSDEISRFSDIVVNIFEKNNILSVGKHFPGHGEAFVDSHKDMPTIDMPFDEFSKNHIAPFKHAIEKNLKALMIAHVYYPFFNPDKKNPASLSSNVIKGFLQEKLGFDGLIFSDDMVMGGITKHFGMYEALKMGIEAGINQFIFRDMTDELLFNINKLEEAVKSGEIDEKLIDISVSKVLKIKEKYAIQKNINKEIDFEKNQKIIDNIAELTIKQVKKSKKSSLIPLKNNEKYHIISFEKNDIYNLSFENVDLKDFVKNSLIKFSSFKFNDALLNEIKINEDETVIFIGYNPHINISQLELLKKIKNRKILINVGVYKECEEYMKCDEIYSMAGFNSPMIRALCKLIMP